jgi:hypothetical protein
MLVPPIVRRREMDRELVRFFHDHRKASFRRAVSKFCRYYHVKSPRIEWYEYIDWGKTAGKTFEDGRIHLVHPENWKRGRVYKSERMWVQMVYHELAHYLFWTDAERKAEAFTHRMVRGLKRARIAGRSRGAGATRAAGARRSARRARDLDRRHGYTGVRTRGRKAGARTRRTRVHNQIARRTGASR